MHINLSEKMKEQTNAEVHGACIQACHQHSFEGFEDGQIFGMHCIMVVQVSGVRAEGLRWHWWGTCDITECLPSVGITTAVRVVSRPWQAPLQAGTAVTVQMGSRARQPRVQYSQSRPSSFQSLRGRCKVRCGGVQRALHMARPHAFLAASVETACISSACHGRPCRNMLWMI